MQQQITWIERTLNTLLNITEHLIVEDKAYYKYDGALTRIISICKYLFQIVHPGHELKRFKGSTSSAYTTRMDSLLPATLDLSWEDVIFAEKTLDRGCYEITVRYIGDFQEFRQNHKYFYEYHDFDIDDGYELPQAQRVLNEFTLALRICLLDLEAKVAPRTVTSV